MFTEEAQKFLSFLLKEDAEIDFKIKYGTEMYRKGFGHLMLKDSQGNEIEGATVKLKQKGHEYKFGCNAFMIESFPTAEQNRQYEETFASLFNLAVVPFYWSDLEPEEGKVRFTKDSPFIYRRPAPDHVVEFCQKYNITPKGHPLCWHNFSPSWMLGKNSCETMRYLARRFEEIAERYADQIPIFDVVNETQTRHPEFRKNTITLPDDYVHRCFKMAERYFPYNHKIYNDDSTWWNFQGDYTPAYLLVKSLLDSGCQVTGMGLQYHMFDNMLTDVCMGGNNRPLSPRSIWRALDQYAKLNIPLNMSEVSILSRRSLGDGDAFQALAFERLYRLWFSHPATEAIVWWNMVDGTAAYAPMGSEEGENRLRAGLVNFDFTDKAAAKVLRRLTQEEWHTETVVEYASGADNSFHGFYGDYEAVITTGKGTFTRQIKLSKYSDNKINLTIE